MIYKINLSKKKEFINRKTMKKLSFLIIINLVLFSSCVCIGSRNLIIEPVNGF